MHSDCYIVKSFIDQEFTKKKKFIIKSLPQNTLFTPYLNLNFILIGVLQRNTISAIKIISSRVVTGEILKLLSIFVIITLSSSKANR